jgi:hypothetical protein
MPSVYVETTIPSYLVAPPSRDLIVAGHQQVTRQWWSQAASGYDLYISEAVLDEISAGNPSYAAQRVSLVQSLPILRQTAEVVDVARRYAAELGLPGSAKADIEHIAYAVAYELDYLVTWNCAHIANGLVIRRLARVNQRHGLWVPTLVTPEELFGTP